VPIKKREAGKVEYELPPEPTLAELGLECFAREIPVAGGGVGIELGIGPIGIGASDPFGDFCFYLPPCLRTAFRTGDFKPGDSIYDSAAAYEGEWREALRKIRFSITVQQGGRYRPVSKVRWGKAYLPV